MAKIKKVIEEGSIQYPATITDAVKNPNNGKTVTQELSELGSKVDKNLSLATRLNKHINAQGEWEDGQSILVAVEYGDVLKVSKKYEFIYYTLLSDFKNTDIRASIVDGYDARIYTTSDISMVIPSGCKYFIMWSSEGLTDAESVTVNNIETLEYREYLIKKNAVDMINFGEMFSKEEIIKGFQLRPDGSLLKDGTNNWNIVRLYLKSGKYRIKYPQSVTTGQHTLWKYSDKTYTTALESVIGVPKKTDEVVELDNGYYIFGWYNNGSAPYFDGVIMRYDNINNEDAEDDLNLPTFKSVKDYVRKEDLKILDNVINKIDFELHGISLNDGTNLYNGDELIRTSHIHLSNNGIYTFHISTPNNAVKVYMCKYLDGIFQGYEELKMEFGNFELNADLTKYNSVRFRVDSSEAYTAETASESSVIWSKDNSEDESKLKYAALAYRSSFEIGTINYNNGSDIDNVTNQVRTRYLKMVKKGNAIIVVKSPIAIRNLYVIKYDGTSYVGYEQVDASNPTFKIKVDSSYNHIRLRMQVYDSTIGDDTLKDFVAVVGYEDDAKLLVECFNNGNIVLPYNQTNIDVFALNSQVTEMRWTELKENFALPTNGVFIGRIGDDVYVSVNGNLTKLNN